MKFKTGIFDLLETGRSPCGERGLKCAFVKVVMLEHRRSPCGERGLKYRKLQVLAEREVAPRAGSVD